MRFFLRIFVQKYKKTHPKRNIIAQKLQKKQLNHILTVAQYLERILYIKSF